jgi:hypothetical protein
VPFSAYRTEIYEKFALFKRNLPPPDTPEYDAARQPIIDFYDRVDTDRNAPEETLKSVVSRMFAAKTQFTGLVHISFQYLFVRYSLQCLFSGSILLESQ